ncbi:MAG: GntR family transcriptional regulator [Treponema sp.]|jgi:GntR family transcriptional regulator|nr:GntR family transcriptional regulator [Treponema sp.]
MQTLQGKIIDYIMTKIKSGEWAVDQMIPTEREFCTQFGVSRPTVRSAMQYMVNKGCLSRTKGRGTFVIRPNILEHSSVFIESFNEEMKQQGLSAQTEVLEFRILPASDEIARKLKQKSGSEAIKLARLRYVRDSFDKGPIVLTTSWFPVRLDFILKYDLEDKSLNSVLIENGFAISHMEKELEAVLLAGKDARLLGQTEHSLAMCIKSVAWDGNGEVLEYTESRYPAARNTFILRISL